MNEPDQPVSLTKAGKAGTSESTAPAAAPRRPWLVAAALAALIALLAVAVLALRAKESDQERQADRVDADARVQQLVALAAVQDAQGPALEAARVATDRLLSYDFRTLDEDFAAGAALLTEDYRAEFLDFTRQIVRPSARQAEAVVQAQVQVLAPTEATTPDRLVALVFVDQTTTSVLLDAPAIDQSRVTVTLVPRAGRWLVDDLEVTGD